MAITKFNCILIYILYIWLKKKYIIRTLLKETLLQPYFMQRDSRRRCLVSNPILCSEKQASDLFNYSHRRVKTHTKRPLPSTNSSKGGLRGDRIKALE